MARARNIKPSFFNNDELAELDPLARLLFIGMWTIADFKGCFEYKPKRVKVQLLPYDDCDIESLAINLDKSGFISIYSVHDQLYIKVLNFDKHQNPHKNERDKGSEIPDISMADFFYCEKQSNNNNLHNIENNPDKNGTNHDKNETDRADSLNLIPSTLIPDSLNTDTQSSDKPKKSKNVLRTLPSDFGISERVFNWAKKEGYENLELHLERFIETATMKVYKYADWDLAFMKAIREDWGKVNKPVYQGTYQQSTPQSRQTPSMADYMQREAMRDITPEQQYFLEHEQ